MCLRQLVRTFVRETRRRTYITHQTKLKHLNQLVQKTDQALGC